MLDQMMSAFEKAQSEIAATEAASLPRHLRLLPGIHAGTLTFEQYRTLPVSVRRAYRRQHGRPLSADELRARKGKALQAIARKRTSRRSRRYNLRTLGRRG
jgi:hypothetical protein